MMLSTDLERGGLPLRLANLARALTSHGVEPIVGSLAPRGPLHPALERDGIETFSCDAAGPRDVTGLVRFVQEVRRINPDLVHASLFHANVVARVLSRLDRDRPVITSTVTIETERRWHRWVESLTSPLSTFHVANSEAVADHLLVELGFDARRLAIIRNGVDLDRMAGTPPADRGELGLPNDVPLIAWAGRMDPVKNLDALVEIVDGVRRHMAVRAVFFGDGPMRDAIKTRVDMLGLSQIILLPGWTDNVVAWFKSADVVVFPSWTEGAPNTVIEAMASGCPVVSSDIPACRELLGGGVSAGLCAPSRVADFVVAVRRVLSSPRLAERASAMGLERVGLLHDLRAAALQWLRRYESLLGLI